MERLLASLAWIGRHERGTVVLVALLATGIWISVAIAGRVLEDEAMGFDRAVLLALRSERDPADPVGPPWVEETVRDVSALGSVAVLAVMTLIVTGFLLLERKDRTALFLAGAIAGGFLLSLSLKAAFGRERPEMALRATHVATASFPSGHSMMAAVVYLTIGALVARAHLSRAVKAYALVLAILLTLLVGASRVYLGVHWPTDVLGGWSVGGTWAVLCWLVATWLQRRGRIEGEEDPRTAGA